MVQCNFMKFYEMRNIIVLKLGYTIRFDYNIIIE